MSVPYSSYFVILYNMGANGISGSLSIFNFRLGNDGQTYKIDYIYEQTQDRKITVDLQDNGIVFSYSNSSYINAIFINTRPKD